MKNNTKFLFALLCSTILVACGGGGSGTSEPLAITDFIAPTITLTGNSNITLTVGDTYQESGSSVTDNVDSGLSASVTGIVDTSSPGSYVLTYSASDSAGNTSSITRTVVVQSPPDTQAPVLTLTGTATITLFVGDDYTEQGASVSDNVDTDLAAVVSGTVDTSTVGSYTITYTATDAASNESSITRTINVEQASNPQPTADAYIFHSQNNDSFAVEFWGDTWDTDTVYTDQPNDNTFAKALEITKSGGWGTVVAWGNEAENTVDISSYTHAKFKVKTDDFTAIQVFVQSASLPESSIIYNFASGTSLGNGWVEMQVTLPGFDDMTWFALNFMGDPATTVLLADVYFTTLALEPVIGPSVAAPTPPEFANDEVIVLYSDSFTQDSFIGVWNANWWNAPIYTTGDVNGNAFAKYQITAGGVEGGVTGLEFGFENGELDASTTTQWNFDLFVEPGISKVEVQLVSKDGGAKYIIENPTTGSWVTYEFLYNELIDNDGNGPGVLNSGLLQSIGIQLWGPEGQSVYVDNIYFSGISVSYDLIVNVVDDNNVALENANVSVGSDSVSSNAAGLATLTLPEGEYKVVADADGFGKGQSNQIISGGDASLTISLKPLNSGPTEAAPVPTDSNDDAFVIYSDVLTVDKPISFWNDNWFNAPVYSEINIGNEKIAKFQIIPDGVSGGVTGIQYGIEGGLVDVSTATGIRFDMYATSGITQAVYQIVSSSGPGISTMLPVPTEQWITVELPFSELVDPTGKFDPAKLNQFGLQLWGSTSDAVYIDNIYFYQ